MSHAPHQELFRHSRYRLLRPLGQGGMGEVFCAQDRLTGAAVALKRVSLRTDASSHEVLTTASPLQELATVAATDPAVGSTLASPRVFIHAGKTDALRFALAQEFRTLASLRHPNIISVLDYGFDAERQPYFTMELLSDAQPLLAGAAGLPPPRKVALLGQLLLALSYLHRRGVLHRDLKPSEASPPLFRREEGRVDGLRTECGRGRRRAPRCAIGAGRRPGAQGTTSRSAAASSLARSAVWHDPLPCQRLPERNHEGSRSYFPRTLDPRLGGRSDRP